MIVHSWHFAPRFGEDDLHSLLAACARRLAPGGTLLCFARGVAECLTPLRDSTAMTLGVRLVAPVSPTVRRVVEALAPHTPLTVTHRDTVRNVINVAPLFQFKPGTSSEPPPAPAAGALAALLQVADAAPLGSAANSKFMASLLDAVLEAVERERLITGAAPERSPPGYHFLGSDASSVWAYSPIEALVISRNNADCVGSSAARGPLPRSTSPSSRATHGPNFAPFDLPPFGQFGLNVRPFCLPPFEQLHGSHGAMCRNSDGSWRWSEWAAQSVAVHAHEDRYPASAARDTARADISSTASDKHGAEKAVRDDSPSTAAARATGRDNNNSSAAAVRNATYGDTPLSHSSRRVAPIGSSRSSGGGSFDPWFPHGNDGPFLNLGICHWNDQRTLWRRRPPGFTPPTVHALGEDQIEAIAARISTGAEMVELPGRISLGCIIDLLQDVWDDDRAPSSESEKW